MIELGRIYGGNVFCPGAVCRGRFVIQRKHAFGIKSELGGTGMEIRFDNHDERIKYYELMLERKLCNLPHFPLPEGYRFVFFRPGDRDQWIDIEKSAKEFKTYEAGLESWNKYYGDKEDELKKRMVFIENADGRKVATATAFYDIRGIDKSGDGWLHWVSVRREYQGRGLAKPLISHVLEIIRGLGYTRAKIPTQTTTWLACKVYLDLGFRPIPENAVHSRNGWRIVKALTDHEALADFEPAALGEILNDDQTAASVCSENETGGHA